MRSTLRQLLSNLAILYILYFVSRVVYVWEFWDIYGADFHQLSIPQLLRGSIRFDTAAICYTNILLILLTLLPLPPQWKESRPYRLMLKSLFVGVNAIMLTINLIDTVYSRYGGRRTTWSFFSEFSHESNLSNIFFTELIHHWYLVVVAIVFIWVLVFLGLPRVKRGATHRRSHLHPGIYYPAHIIATVLGVMLAIGGIRGGFSTAIRPIAISNANQYVLQPSQAAIVLNTPFSIIRTCGKTTFQDPAYFTPDQLDSLYTPIHQPTPPVLQTKPNVVILILESMATEYWGHFNTYTGHTPFLDSLAQHSLTFNNYFANGRKSIDAMPSILSSIPMYVEPFFVTNYSLNDVSSVAGELAKQGYHTAFFHGAENGSMGFQAYARTAGFAHYYGRTEYCADPHFNGMDDFDGTWAIWDEEFLQFYAASMSQMPQPFVTSVFTATSHHPFVVPERYQSSLSQPGHPIYTCVRYTDQALRRFFHTASSMPWYANTIFVITADHTNHTEQQLYSTPMGIYRVPLVIFDPSGRLPRGQSNAIAQQTDILPTLMGTIGCSRPYLAFGIDLLHTPADSTYAINYNNGIYQYISPNLCLLYDGAQVVGLYHTDQDPLMKHNMASDSNEIQRQHTHLLRLQAAIQSYMSRMIHNQLTP